MTDHSYHLGTQDEEIARLGLQHRVWRSRTLEGWTRAGLRPGMKVLDAGAGPGFAAADMAEIVGPSGRVHAFERSERFEEIGRARIHAMGLANVDYVRGDLVTDALPEGDYDMIWCRWVLCFVTDPEAVVQKFAGSLKPGGRLVSHEYLEYGTWTALPRRPMLERFVEETTKSWRDGGGEPNIARDLPGMLQSSGLNFVECRPHVFTVSPADYAWNWPRLFIENQTPRLVEEGRFDGDEGQAVLNEMRAATADPRSLMVTPLVLETIAARD